MSTIAQKVMMENLKKLEKLTCSMLREISRNIELFPERTWAYEEVADCLKPTLYAIKKHCSFVEKAFEFELDELLEKTDYKKLSGVVLLQRVYLDYINQSIDFPAAERVLVLTPENSPRIL